jgi:hypothetical protein
MANKALAVLEDALRVRKLDRTLTTALPPLDHRADASTLAATDITQLDACLRGGLPRGQLSEIAGPQSSGRTLLLVQMMAAATRRGDIAALVDTCDQLDLASAVAAGVDLDRLLWIRGDQCGFRLQAEGRLQAEDRAIDRALKALNLVLQAGGFGVVAIDLADVPLSALARIPLTTWLRVQRTIEGSDTACVIVGPQPLARSARGVTLSVTGRPRWNGDADRSRLLTGLNVSVRIVSPRRVVEGDVEIAATATDHGTPSHRGTEKIFNSVSQCLGVSSL